MTQPSLRGRVVLKFPASVVAGPGILIDKTNSTYTFSIDPDFDFGTGGGDTTPGGGIGEAPNDGQQYGRQSLSWTVITGGGGGPGGTIGNPLLIEKGTAPQIGIIGTVGGLNRWRLNLGDSEPETGIAGGSDFHLDSYNNDGTYRNLVIHADRDTSEVTITGGPAPHHAILSLNKLASGQASAIQGKTSGSLRWGISLGDGVAESLGTNVGSDFRINAYDDGGNFANAPLYIERKTSKVMLTGGAFTTTGVPILAINKLTTSGQAASIQGQTAGVARWGLTLGDVLAESGTSSGSDLRINRYNNAGALIDVPFWIKRDTGTVVLTGAHPAQEAFLAINKTSGGLAATIQGQTATVRRWDLVLGDGAAETGAQSGSDFRIHRYNNAGTLIDVPVWIRRDNGVTTFTGSPPDQAPIIVINKTSGGGTQSSSIQGQTLTSTRWHLALGDGGVESGANNGSDFRVHRHDDSGVFITAAMYIKRSDGVFAVYGPQCFRPGSATWDVISDARIKTVSGDYTQGLAAVKALHPVKYTYKGNDVRYSPIPVSPGVPAATPGQPDKRSEHYSVAASGKEFIGLVAQEAEVSMPELVKQTIGTIDGALVSDLREMDTGPLIFALINAVKELSARVEALEGAP